MTINDIPANETGGLLIMAIAKISSELDTDKTPDEILQDLIERRDKVYGQTE